jgi:hypothetical protein
MQIQNKRPFIPVNCIQHALLKPFRLFLSGYILILTLFFAVHAQAFH